MEKPPLANARNGHCVQVPEEAANDVLVNLNEDESCVAKPLSVVSCQLKSKLINGKLAAMLEDTGSSVTIVSETMAKGCALSPSGAVTVSSATGDCVPIIGKCNFRFRIGQKISIMYTAFVSRNFPYDCI